MLTCDVALRRDRFALEARIECDEGVTGLLGRSGSGKSTLLGIIAGLIRPQEGKVVLDGDVLFDGARGVFIPAHRRRVGLVFQDSQLFPQYSVRGNLLYGHARLRQDEIRFRFDDIVDMLAIGHLLDAHPRQISGGEKQRVALGRSLLASPRLLLLDEPLASLDGQLKEQILPFLERIKRELGLPMIYVSHSLPEVLYLTDRLAFMAEGRITASGNLRELLATAPGNRLAGLGGDNVLAVAIEAHDAEGGCTVGVFAGHHLLLPLRPALGVGATAYVSVHRGEVTLASRKVEGVSIQNQLAGRVVGIENRGGAVHVQIDAGTPLWAEITPRAWQELNLHEGDWAYCLIKTRSIAYLTDRESAGSSFSPAALPVGET
ncbi:molybdenum ABC transporter ATP-binding protein [Methylococcus sp. EFPC2]|uniref:molybdenum ABC transporter ATP-binding protein n=1 Tax=Methylococcus sp. EFPC2 TaxID=2812648 RepID=UPI0019679995|nr:molybdenum ABC transporter ATP-binding protein [Methylococcus sp. EFPC2]QSA96783.1 molybdenum ABC transporter ATP-binding protein [Methylococcus sp. EFPC2]